MKFSDTNKMPNHTYESTRRELGKNHITGDAYRNILEFIRKFERINTPVYHTKRIQMLEI